jgi:hypothetical protein
MRGEVNGYQLKNFAQFMFVQIVKHNYNKKAIADVTVHLAPRQLWLIDLGRVFKGFPGYSGLPSNGI